MQAYEWKRKGPEMQGKHTVWKFCNFSIIQILREIDFGGSRSAKSALLTHFEALNFDFFYKLLHFLKGCNLPN